MKANPILLLLLGIAGIAFLFRRPVRTALVTGTERIVSMATPRGIRNNNPGNIRENPGDKTQWVGERATDDDPIFEEFTTPEAGIRALTRVLLNYQTKYGLRTVRQLINRWAPSNENNTDSYVKVVAKAANLGPDDAIDLYAKPNELQMIVTAIIKHENGQQPYANTMIAKAVRSAIA